MAMPMICSLPAWRFCSATICGISTIQGGHQLAQKSTSTSLPRQAASETGLPSKPVRVKAGAAAPGDSGAARAPSQTRPQARQTRRAAILAVNNRIALLRPVGAEIVRDIKNLQLRKAHLAQGAPRGGDIGAMIPGTAAAIDDHRLGLVERP